MLDWVTCDKCGFIGVRNIKTRELEEMEDNQRTTGQPILTHINSLGDTEPRHERIPECLMHAENFTTLSPLSSQPLPLFYMQLPRQCPQFTKWAKGFSPKEHKEITDRQPLGDEMQPKAYGKRKNTSNVAVQMATKVISEQQANTQQLVEALETHKLTETEQYNLAIGKHRIRIVELLNTWKEQLSLMSKSDKIDEIVAL